MAFDITTWKDELKARLPGWQVRMQAAGTNSAYYFIAAAAFLPIAQAFQSGNIEPFAFTAIVSGLGANLLANIVQNWRDEASAAAKLQEAAQTDPELQPKLDALLKKLEALKAAEFTLGTEDKAWFAETLQRELKALNSGIHYEAHLTGSGAIAQGNRAKAVGAGGTLIEGGVNGDVIAAGGIKIVQPDPREIAREEEDKARRAYLEKLRRHCQVLPLAVLGGEESTEAELSLDDVYIDLDTTYFIKTTDLNDLRAGKKQSLPQVALVQETPDLQEHLRERDDLTPLPVFDAIRSTPRVVLLGEPGAGKSTFARKVLGLQAAVLLGQCQQLPGFSLDLLPVLVILRELVTALDNLNLETLPAEQQKQKLLEVVQKQQSAPFVNTALERGKVLLVLDGLDEVPQDLRKIVRQTVAALLSTYRVERLLITSRIRSYTGNAIFENLPTFTLRPFDKEKISGFVRAWYGTQTMLGRVSEKDCNERIKDMTQAATSGDLRDIASNPMMLTSMAIIHQKEIGLPRERVRLYKLVVDVLLRRWQKHKLGEGQMALSAALVAFLKDENRLLATMERLAYEAHRAGKGEKHTADLPRLQALELLEQKGYLGKIGLAHEFLDYVDQRSGLIKGNGGELDKPTSYSFPHRTFQEYLAGCYLIRDRSAAREYYRHAAEGDFWALAVQLGAEELYHNRRGQPYMRDLAYELLPGKRPVTATDQRAALWSGLVAQIAGKNEIEADENSPKGGSKYLNLARLALLTVMQGDLPPLERAEAGRVLARLGDPRPEVLFCEKMAFCHIPAGEFLIGSKKDDKQADDDEKPQRKVNLPEYWMSKYPVTNAQFAQFVAAGGYANPKYWEAAKKEKYWTKDGFKGRYDDERRSAPVNLGEPFILPNHPVVGVSWYEALAFTRWLTEQLPIVSGQWAVNSGESDFREKIRTVQHCIDLPTEAQWEKATRGVDGRQYPWAGEFDPNKANSHETGIDTTSAVGCFPGGQSPYGLLDVSGNIWEWVNGKNNLRGGSFASDRDYARCASRFRSLPDLRNFGFRVVVVFSSR